MMGSNQELEVKLCVSDLESLEHRLHSLGGILTHPRRLEVNLRFDTPEKELSRSQRVLRLRRYEEASLTYKGPSDFISGVRSRQEVEFTVGDFEAARDLLEALGYQVVLIYEKYRTAYQINAVEISMDELPYGDFIEIEGPDSHTIRALADKLNLDWSARIPKSYNVLFGELKKKLELPFRDLTFENFKTLQVSPADLGVHPADI